LSSPYTRALSEITCLYLDCVDVEIGNVDVVRFEAVWRQIAPIQARTAVMQFVAAPMRQREDCVTVANARQRVRQIGQPMRDEMDDLALSLDAAVDPIILAERITRRCVS
jgi:hypothetical protein